MWAGTSLGKRSTDARRHRSERSPPLSARHAAQLLIDDLLGEWDEVGINAGVAVEASANRWRTNIREETTTVNQDHNNFYYGLKY